VKLAQLQIYDSPTLAGLARANTMHRVVLEADADHLRPTRRSARPEHSVSDLQFGAGDLPTDARERTPSWRRWRLSSASRRPAGELTGGRRPVCSGARRHRPDRGTSPRHQRAPACAGGASIVQHAVRTYVDPMTFGHVIVTSALSTTPTSSGSVLAVTRTTRWWARSASRRVSSRRCAVSTAGLTSRSTLAARS